MLVTEGYDDAGNPVYTFSDKAKLTIHCDQDPPDPREWDNLGKMVCWHPSYNLGDEQICKTDFSDADAVLADLKSEFDIAVSLPLYLYDHSGITMNTTGFSCPWDSGQVGWIFCTKEQVELEFKGDVEKVKAYLVEEVKVYNQYLTGDVYGFVLKYPPCMRCGGDTAADNSCWGFYGFDILDNGVLDCIDTKYCDALKEMLSDC